MTRAVFERSHPGDNSGGNREPSALRQAHDGPGSARSLRCDSETYGDRGLGTATGSCSRWTSTLATKTRQLLDGRAMWGCRRCCRSARGGYPPSVGHG